MLISIDENTAIKGTIIFAGIEVFQSSLECLIHHKIYRKDQWLSWDLLKGARPFFTSNAWAADGFDLLFRYPNILWLFGLRLGLAAALLFSARDVNWHHIVVLVTAITCMGILLGWRNLYSNNGSDQLTNIILIPVCIFSVFISDPWIRTLSIYFIACQSELSYLTSGLFKLINKNWRNGSSLTGVFSTRVWGTPYLKRWLDKRPSLYRYCSYLVIGGELLLGCSFIFPPDICLFILFAGALFHLTVAIIMGLNTFLWAFTSTYFCIYYISILHHQ